MHRSSLVNPSSVSLGSFNEEHKIENGIRTDADDGYVLHLEKENRKLKNQLSSLLEQEICPFFASMAKVLDPLAIKVLSFWFGPKYEGGGGDVAPEQYHLWFGKSADTDLEIQVRFGDQLDRAASGLFDHWCAHPYGTLALVILTDQFSRNIFRDQARGFAYDWKACLCVWEAFETKQDDELSPLERVWFYLVLTHTEDLQSQRLCVALGNLKLDGMDQTFKKMWQTIFVKHLAVIEKFGRFAHRNKALRRIPTQEEEQFVNDPAYRFDLPVKLSMDPETGAAKFEFVTREEEGEEKAEDENQMEDKKKADAALIEEMIGKNFGFKRAVKKVIAVKRLSTISLPHD